MTEVLLGSASLEGTASELEAGASDGVTLAGLLEGELEPPQEASMSDARARWMCFAFMFSFFRNDEVIQQVPEKRIFIS